MMISLSYETPFAMGGRRACYVHPDNRDRCIKVALPEAKPEMLHAKDPWWKRLRPVGYYNENLLDLKIHRLLAARLGESSHLHFPKVYGLVTTDLGQGLETDLIRDPDGRIALSGKEYTMQNGTTDASEQALLELREFLVNHLILFRDPFPHNVIFQSLSDGRLRAVIIDGVGRRVFLSPILRQSSQRRVKKKFARLLKGVLKTKQIAKNGVPQKQNGILLHR